MNIGVISDTHSRAVSTKVLDDLRKMDFVIHAGDIGTKAFFEEFKKVNDVKAVYGNMDDGSLRSILPKSQIINCASFAIGVFHGEGHPAHLVECVKQEFKNKKVDVIVFGHSHSPMNEKIDGILFFNPGSATDTTFAPYRSYGILEINDVIKGRIIKIDEN
jgi:putative phosphoesterase